MRRLARCAQFRRDVEALLRGLGAVDSGEWYRLRIDTMVGPLMLHPMDDGWLAARFTEVERAVTMMNPRRDWTHRLNPISGKWNFHPDLGSAKAVVEELLLIEQQVSRLLPATIQATPAFELSVDLRQTRFGHHLRFISAVPHARLPDDRVQFQAVFSALELQALRDAIDEALSLRGKAS
jgi:hypothetical protein